MYYSVNIGKLMKKIISILMLFAANILYAEDKLSAGLTAGYQYDTGMLSEKAGIQAKVQHNISAGLVLKLDMSRIFLRTGVEYSYPFQKGEIENSSAGFVEGTAISFIEAPVYAGINLVLRDFGAFYMGGGISYIFGLGNVDTSSGDKKIREQVSGYGMIAGIQSEIYSNASILFEWEYMAARTSPVTSTAGVYDDYCIDYSGSRLRFGIIYHFNRE